MAFCLSLYYSHQRIPEAFLNKSATRLTAPCLVSSTLSVVTMRLCAQSGPKSVSTKSTPSTPSASLWVQSLKRTMVTSWCLPRALLKSLLESMPIRLQGFKIDLDLDNVFCVSLGVSGFWTVLVRQCLSHPMSRSAWPRRSSKPWLVMVFELLALPLDVSLQVSPPSPSLRYFALSLVKFEGACKSPLF